LQRSVEHRERAAVKAEARRLLDLLTPREFEVMQMLLTGMLNKQVGAELGMAEKTVKLHRGRIMRKIGVVSVAELVRVAANAGVTVPKTVSAIAVRLQG
jgi:FixJ family two-component response regulator